MEVKNHADLEKILTLCRKKGVETIKIGDVTVQFGHSEPVSRYKKKQESSEASADQYTEEDMLFWSSVPQEGLKGDKPV